MAIHTVKQGETLLRIAKQHGLGSVATLYDHPSNQAFRESRPNPDLIYPGDRIVIPEPESQQVKLGKTTQKSVFVKSSTNEYLRLRFKGCQGRRGVLNVNGQAIESAVNDSGMLEFALPEQAGHTATLELYLSEDDAEPTHRIKTKLAYLDPVNTLTGIQARCNNLGFDCGVVDGVMGQKTREGVMQFQASTGLNEDGEPGPLTQQKLEESYGI